MFYKLNTRKIFSKLVYYINSECGFYIPNANIMTKNIKICDISYFCQFLPNFIFIYDIIIKLITNINDFFKTYISWDLFL